jgi:hypothetical protein
MGLDTFSGGVAGYLCMRREMGDLITDGYKTGVPSNTLSFSFLKVGSGSTYSLFVIQDSK